VARSGHSGFHEVNHHPFTPLAREFAAGDVRYLLIGVSGANLYGPAGQAIFVTDDFDAFLPPDPANLVRAWEACDRAALDLWMNKEPLDRPRDRWLAERFVERLTLTRATGPNDVQIDLTLVMKGFDFDTVWAERREFIIDGVPVPTARLLHIVESKQAAGRPKDQLFLATHQDALEQLLGKTNLDDPHSK
jgi:hypothetical protein